jgi:hypothetical protein
MAASLQVTLFPFRHRDSLSGRWIKACYKATREEIAARHAEWEITGLAEVRSPIGGGFNQYRVVPHRDETVAETDEQREPAP